MLLPDGLVESWIFGPAPRDVVQVAVTRGCSMKAGAAKEGLEGDGVEALAFSSGAPTNGPVQSRRNPAKRVLHPGSLGGQCLHVERASGR